MGNLFNMVFIKHKIKENKSMKILFTTFAYYPEKSGVPIVVQYLAEGLAGKGHSVAVATRMNGRVMPSHEVINNVDVYRFDIGQTLFKTNTGNVDDYISFVRTFKKDALILECLQCHTTDLLLPFLNEMDCKIVVHSHGIPGLTMNLFSWQGDLIHSIGNIHNWIRWKKYYRKTFPKYCKTIDLGISLSLCASDVGYFSKRLKKTAIVENAANHMFFCKENYQKDISEILKIQSQHYIVNISNYSDRKNQLTLIKEYEKAQLKDCALVLIGNERNSYCKKVIRLANQVKERSGCEIKVLYGIEREWFPAIIEKAMVFVMTSKWEEYPVSLVETMAVGTPFISTMVGNAHVLPGGVIARSNGEIAVLLRTLYDNPVILHEFGQQGKKYALEHNDLEKVIDGFENALYNC